MQADLDLGDQYHQTCLLCLMSFTNCKTSKTKSLKTCITMVSMLLGSIPQRPDGKSSTCSAHNDKGGQEQSHI